MMMPRDDGERDEGGRFVNEIDAADILNAMEPGKPYATSEVAELVGLTRRGALNYLDDLEEAGKVDKHKPNKTTAIWMKPQ